MKSNLGLKRGTVRSVPYSKQWPIVFERTSAAGLPGLHIEHIGCTVLPGMMAKPILNVLLGHPVRQKPEGYINVLEGAGFTPRGPRAPGRLLFIRGTSKIRTHHLHLVEHMSEEWRTPLIFRDLLRSDPALVKKYTECKTRLTALHAHNRADLALRSRPF